jgi:translation initiation factor 2B subunit (eIF-2B alpha/beta/delta family)
MTNIPPDLDRRIALLATDRESGASEILDEVVGILRDALAVGVPMKPVARALCRAQPSMAPVWNAALEALASASVPDRFDRFAHRLARAPAALARFAAEAFSPALADAPRPARHPGRPVPLRLVTISFSRTVVGVLEALAWTRPLRVSCSESRPALEGRRLASRLAGTGVAVTCFADAAIGHALASAEAVLLGADAVAPEWFLNKSGTRMLAAAATQQGVPIYVVASRDKFVSHAVAARLLVKEGAAAEIWASPPAGVTVRNPYFESTPLDLVTGVITDAGVLGAGMVPEVCNASLDPFTLQALDALT